jgi:16S rRNA (cytosine1402-N4)-methyltransferase
MSDMQLALPGLLAELTQQAPVEWIWTYDPEEENHAMAFVHATVMRDEVVAALAPRDGGVYVDVTLGGGGHSQAILDAAPGARVIGRDPAAVAAASERLAPYGDRMTIVRSNFGDARDALASIGVAHVDGLCADLGVSSPQIDDPARGMSFRHEGPIDMRMDTDNGETGLELIGRLSDDELADIIFRYGDERRSRRIARSIKRAFDDGELETTLDLRRTVVRAVGPARVGGVDPATRTFQALRIAVNRELEELEALLASLSNIVGEGGRASIISFHSLEDRLVKRAFHVKQTWEPLFKKPMGPSEVEEAENPRSRSAKMRAARLRSPFEDAP